MRHLDKFDKGPSLRIWVGTLRERPSGDKRFDRRRKGIPASV